MMPPPCATADGDAESIAASWQTDHVVPHHTDDQERNVLWRLSRRVIPRLYRLKGSQRPLPFVEDISIPPKRLPDFLLEIQNVLKAERVTATLFSHAAHGQLDLRPFLDLGNPQDQEKLARLSEAIYSKVMAFGGCISGEHALGLSRAAMAARQLGPRFDLCRQIKEIFDPNDILNPGKFMSVEPARVDENLRPVPKYQLPQTTLAVGSNVIPPRHFLRCRLRTAWPARNRAVDDRRAAEHRFR